MDTKIKGSGFFRHLTTKEVHCLSSQQLGGLPNAEKRMLVKMPQREGEIALWGQPSKHLHPPTCQV